MFYTCNKFENAGKPLLIKFLFSFLTFNRFVVKQKPLWLWKVSKHFYALYKLSNEFGQFIDKLIFSTSCRYKNDFNCTFTFQAEVLEFFESCKLQQIHACLIAAD